MRKPNYCTRKEIRQKFIFWRALKPARESDDLMSLVMKNHRYWYKRTTKRGTARRHQRPLKPRYISLPGKFSRKSSHHKYSVKNVPRQTSTAVVGN